MPLRCTSTRPYQATTCTWSSIPKHAAGRAVGPGPRSGVEGVRDAVDLRRRYPVHVADPLCFRARADHEPGRPRQGGAPGEPFEGGRWLGAALEGGEGWDAQAPPHEHADREAGLVVLLAQECGHALCRRSLADRRGEVDSHGPTARADATDRTRAQP